MSCSERPRNPLLAGLKVLDLSRLLPGPFCSQYLAQLGAEVIKIEDPDGGDYARGMPELFDLINRGKASVTLDLRDEADRARFFALVKDADVVLESFRPGVMDKLGCGYEDLRTINPKLVYASLTGYGHNGPYRDRAGHDMNYLALAGVLDQIGTAGGPPALSNVQVADLAGGALTCAIGLLSAVIGARQSGVGTFVDVAMLDGSLALQAVALSALNASGAVPQRGAGLLTGALPNYSVYACRDGRYLAVGALEPKFVRNLLKALGDSAPPQLRALASLAPRKRKHGGRSSKVARGAGGGPFDALQKWIGPISQARRRTAPLRWVLAGVFRLKTRDQWAALLEDADACVTPILSLDEVLNDPHVQARGMILGSKGAQAFNLPIQFSDACVTNGDTPALGADNDSVLGETRSVPS